MVKNLKFDYMYYEPFLICKKTHGVILGDYSWIRFEGETLTWEDVKIKS